METGTVINAVAYTPDSATVVIGGEDGKVRYVSLAERRITKVAQLDIGAITCLQLSEDGRSLCIGGSSGKVRVLDLVDDRSLLAIDQADRGLFAFSADGRFLASGDNGASLVLWDVKQRRVIWSTGPINEYRPVRGVAFSSDGGRLAAAFQYEAVVWNTNDKTTLFRVDGSTFSRVYSVDLSPDGKFVAVGGTVSSLLDEPRNVICVYDLQSGALVHSADSYERIPATVTFSADSKLLATAQVDQVVRVWRLDGWSEALSADAHNSALTSVSVSDDGTIAASGGIDGTVRLWDIRTGKLKRTLTCSRGRVYAVLMSGAKLFVSALGRTPEIQVWDLKSLSCERRINTGHYPAFCLGISRSGRVLAWGSGAGSVCLFDLINGQSLSAIELLRPADFAGGREFAHHGEINVPDPSGDVLCIAFSPDDSRLAIGAPDLTVRILDMSTRVEQLSLQGHTDYVRSVAFSVDGKSLFSASRDKTIRVWDIESGRPTSTLQGHTAEVLCLSVCASSGRLASGSCDQTIRIWDPATGEELRRIVGHQGPVTAVSCCSKSSKLVSGGADSTMLAWEFPR
jgi:WD40 repeat protein